MSTGGNNGVMPIPDLLKRQWQTPRLSRRNGQPRPQGLQITRGRAEAAQQLLRLASWRADQDAADDAGLVDIQAGAAFEENIHGQHLS